MIVSFAIRLIRCVSFSIPCDTNIIIHIFLYIFINSFIYSAVLLCKIMSMSVRYTAHLLCHSSICYKALYLIWHMSVAVYLVNTNILTQAYIYTYIYSAEFLCRIRSVCYSSPVASKLHLLRGFVSNTVRVCCSIPCIRPLLRVHWHHDPDGREGPLR